MSLNDEIAEYIDRKYADKQRLRDARAAELKAVWRKLESECRLTFEMEIARRKKV
jgi:hypothetical protein